MERTYELVYGVFDFFAFGVVGLLYVDCLVYYSYKTCWENSIFLHSPLFFVSVLLVLLLVVL